MSTESPSKRTWMAINESSPDKAMVHPSPSRVDCTDDGQAYSSGSKHRGAVLAAAAQLVEKLYAGKKKRRLTSKGRPRKARKTLHGHDQHEHQQAEAANYNTCPSGTNPQCNSTPSLSAEALSRMGKSMSYPEEYCYEDEDDAACETSLLSISVRTAFDLVIHPGISRSSPPEGEEPTTHFTAGSDLRDIFTSSTSSGLRSDTTSPRQQESSCSATDESPSYQTSNFDKTFSLAPTSTNELCHVKPFIRQPLSLTQWDHNQSAIPLLAPSLRIPTCFRIAELLRLLSDRTGPFLFAVELYALVIAESHTEDQTVRHLRLADVFFPQRPPYVLGVMQTVGQPDCFEGSLSPESSKELVRLIVRPMLASVVCSSEQPVSQGIFNNQAGIRAYVHILSIRESDWDELQYVHGIVDPSE